MKEPLRVLDLFSGIGGFSLGLERAGMRTVAFCEQDGYACRVLRKHWPTVPIFEDVRTLTKRRLAQHGIEVDVICGGFPCQDISFAGKGAGLKGERSGLWGEFARLIREIRPRFAIVENVAALRSRGLDQVLGDLAAIGFDAEWHCIPASYVGAPHRRDRVWIVANAARSRGDATASEDQRARAGRSRIGQLLRESGDRDSSLADSTAKQRRGSSGQTRHTLIAHQAIPHTASSRRKARRPHGMGKEKSKADASPQRRQWALEPNLPRVVDGLPHRVDRLRCIGNAVVPQIVEMIGRAIVKQARKAAVA